MPDKLNDWPSILADKYFNGNFKLEGKRKRAKYPPDFLEHVERLEKTGVFPERSVEAIVKGFIKLSAKKAKKWQSQDDETFQRIGRLIFWSSLTYRDALRILKHPMDENYSLVKFVYLSIAHGGRGSVTFRGYTVTAAPLTKMS